ncbi:MAG: dihydrodipicolinate synthase family protein [Firmicutes bacterium]|nr:dihydrodipicolinate synthase family protein [Bacillota bacterium]
MKKELYPMKGIVTTVISPFIGENKALDVESLHNEIDMACKAGVAGFLVPCLASEQPLLTLEEKKLLVAETAKAAAGRAKLITSITAPTTEERVRLMHEFQECGIDGFNMQVPHETEKEFMEAIEGVDRENPQFLFLQDADFNGPGIDNAWTVKAFNTFSSVVGAKLEVKFTAPKCSELLRLTDGKMLLASGWGNDQLLELLDRGVHTVMPSGMFELWTKVYALHSSGNRAAAQRLFYDMLPIITFTRQSQELNRWFHKHYLKSFGAFQTDMSREQVYLDEYHIHYADELIQRAKDLIGRLDSYQ